MLVIVKIEGRRTRNSIDEVLIGSLGNEFLRVTDPQLSFIPLPVAQAYYNQQTNKKAKTVLSFNTGLKKEKVLKAMTSDWFSLNCDDEREFITVDDLQKYRSYRKRSSLILVDFKIPVNKIGLFTKVLQKAHQIGDTYSFLLSHPKISLQTSPFKFAPSQFDRPTFHFVANYFKCQGGGDYTEIAVRHVYLWLYFLAVSNT